MMRFVRRVAAIVAVAFVSVAAAMVVTPGVSSADCGPNMSFNPVTNVCKLPPAPPAWYTPRPAYAPPYAPQNVPPPPPWPSWSSQPPMWDNGFQHWGVWLSGVWVPL